MNPFSKTFLLCLAALVVCSGCSSIKRFMYEGPGRDDWQKPEQVIAALGLEPGDQVADLGSGGGYFTFPMAEVVGKTGQVYAVDVDESLLAYIAKQSQKRGLSQIKTVLAPTDGLGLPDASVDLIFLSNVFHHLPDPADYFRRARSILRAGGRIVVIDFSENGFLAAHATPADEIQTQFEAAGYRLAKRHDFLERQNFQIFVVRSDPSSN
jgi:ubiquinone/menaquinone biosynthesis C-methylase UbiE